MAKKTPQASKKKEVKKKTYRILMKDDSDQEPSIKQDYTLREAQKLAKSLRQGLHAPEIQYLVQKWNGKKWEYLDFRHENLSQHEEKKEMTSHKKAQWLFDTYGHEAVPMVKTCMKEFEKASTKKEKYWKTYWKEVMNFLKPMI